MMELPNISQTTARKIIRNRPYHDREDLLANNLLLLKKAKTERATPQ
jgi:hypothetical protein